METHDSYYKHELFLLQEFSRQRGDGEALRHAADTIAKLRVYLDTQKPDIPEDTAMIRAHGIAAEVGG